MVKQRNLFYFLTQEEAELQLVSLRSYLKGDCISFVEVHPVPYSQPPQWATGYDTLHG